MRNLRENRDFKNYQYFCIPLDGSATKEAAMKVGASGYVVKNDIANIIQYLDDLIAPEKAAIAESQQSYDMLVFQTNELWG